MSVPSYDCRNVGCRLILIVIQMNFLSSILVIVLIFLWLMVRLQFHLRECVEKVGINESCGGYTPPKYQTRCMDGLECVQTMGPMIADAPGQCREPCNRGEQRNQYGDCIVQNVPTIPDNCVTWNDGCNTCQVRNGRADICTYVLF